MKKQLPELSILLPSVYSYLQLIDGAQIAEALIAGFLSLVSISLFYIRYKENATISNKPVELQELELEAEKERLKISVEEMKYHANKNRIMRDNAQAGKTGVGNKFAF